MRSPTSLIRLAERAGILTEYEDVFGETHEASPSTLRAVLNALGIGLSDDADADSAADAALAAFDARLASRVLEPVYVLAEHGAWRIACRLGARGDLGDLRFVVELESGERLTGSAGASASFTLPHPLPLGYHRLVVEHAGERHEARLIVAPERCWLPPEFEERGAWGLAVQVYALRSARNWGVGDFTDLRHVCDAVRDAGGAAVAVNPLHWLAPGESSPYGPTSREFVNWLYLDASALPGALAGDVSEVEIAGARASDLVDYERALALHGRAARAAFERFAVAPRGAAHDAFEAYVREGGERLREAATFAALAEQFRLAGGSTDWRSWPEPYRDARSAEVFAFAREREDDLAFFAYLQWQAAEQLGRVAEACAGMPIGLYRDLAVGTQLGGFDTWRAGNALCAGAAVGAPPDLLNRAGQNWGVAPFDPLALREAAYAPFVELIRANVAHAGALRIDHVMGLLRLWFVPEGCTASEGAYVTYRLDELLGVLALESRRGRFVVVGEDLGTVPEGFRERLERAGVFSYRVLQFEHDDVRFFDATEYPRLALVATGTHDLPTMAGFWRGADIELRAELGTLRADDIEAERKLRERQRERLRSVFAKAGIALDDRMTNAEIGRAANEFLSRAPSRLLMVQLEDVLGEIDQVNVPATTHEHPNWRRRSPLEVDRLRDDERFVALANAIGSRR